jgi:hypothetical protein
VSLHAGGYVEAHTANPLSASVSRQLPGAVPTVDHPPASLAFNTLKSSACLAACLHCWSRAAAGWHQAGHCAGTLLMWCAYQRQRSSGWPWVSLGLLFSRKMNTGK